MDKIIRRVWNEIWSVDSLVCVVFTLACLAAVFFGYS